MAGSGMASSGSEWLVGGVAMGLACWIGAGAVTSQLAAWLAVPLAPGLIQQQQASPFHIHYRPVVLPPAEVEAAHRAVDRVLGRRR